MTIRTIKITANATKEEETEFLRQFAATIPAGSYLESLFSGDLIDWAALQIHNDVAPDAHGTIVALNNDLASYRASLHADQENLKSLRGLVDAVQQERSREVDEYERRIDSLRGDCNEAYRRAQDAEYELEQARKQIAALKIELFNREHPELA